MRKLNLPDSDISRHYDSPLRADEHRPDLGGEALNVTVLFSDIRGFTSLSEKPSAHEVVEMLNAYFTRVCEPIVVQGGAVDKYIGDAVMAVFGSPAQYPDHARRAIQAALGMAREAEGFTQCNVIAVRPQVREAWDPFAS